MYIPEMMGRLSFGETGPSSLEKQAKQGGLKPGISLYDHQQDAVSKLLAKDGSLLFSHPVGSGKTLSSIAGFEALRDIGKANRALVVVPASLRTNYLENGIHKFTNAGGAIFGTAEEVKNGTGVSLENPDDKARYHIVSYDLFRKEPEKYIKAAGADTVIYDELHKAKNEGVLTSVAIKKARPFHRNFIGMTGSIVSNTPADIVPLVDAMTNGKHVLGNKTVFESRFVKTDDQGQKSLNHPQVLRTLLGPYLHHVDPKDLNIEAPKKKIEEIHVEMSPHQVDLYRYVSKDLDWVTQKKMEMGVGKLSSAELNDIFAKLTKLRQVSNAIHTVDSRLSLSDSAKQSPKIRNILDDVEEHLRETKDGQVVIHSNMIVGGVDVLTQGLKDRGIDHALFIGKGQPGVTEKSRQHGVAEYQAGKKRVIVLSAAGGEGLDLPNTTMMLMADGHFNPERINQAEARGIRAGGQKHRDAKDREVIVRRYMSVLPNDLSQKARVLHGISENMPGPMLTRLAAGGPAWVNPFTKKKSTDEWVYGVAKTKGKLNTELYNTVKHGSVEHGPRTHEEFELLLLEKCAELDQEDPEVLRGVRAGARVGHGLKHLGPYAELTGALLGGVYGGVMHGGTPPRTKREVQQDPNAARRNRIGALAGGTLGGALSIAMARRNGVIDSSSWSNFIASTSMGASAGKSVAGLWAPTSKVPSSVTHLLGSDRQRYADKDVFEKYWSEFGKELEDKGVEHHVANPEREQKYLDALRDLYGEARLNNAKGEAPKKSKFLTGAAIGLAMTPIMGWLQTGISGAVAKINNPAHKFKSIGTGLGGDIALATIPYAVGYLGSTAKQYRENYVDPGVTVKNKTEAKARARFDDDQLRKLLRGLGVEEVKTKQHVIK